MRRVASGPRSRGAGASRTLTLPCQHGSHSPPRPRQGPGMASESLRAVISRDDVLAARATIGDRVHRTPTFGSRTLSEEIGAPAFLKAELFQRTGSFKPRGVLSKLAALTPEERARGVITWSAGT